ncbi:alpha/beta-hydrolase [Dendrothele bispora CBS 962.96]|uniref:Alpha/beta-hydrolase n=1 Tax=Dendrothele bispora (strain CBS 962.96) TaxID=1314807 RepID=A0A4S8M8G5_DENBC|nr:alpha/beta-hydrolase [Dendrothele bispora CBS 962.96]
MPTSRLVPGRYPAPGVSPIADKIRERRGARGLTPLDGTLLHVPAVAEGWNTLLGAVRTKGQMPGDVRELMILRVAARNSAAFEWIHHEHVGRDCGLNTSQLYLIRDTSSLPSSTDTTLTPLQSSALAFADQSTSKIHVDPSTTSSLLSALKTLASNDTSKAQDLLVECAAIVSSYNMVSRFLVSLDIAAMSDNPVPWPSQLQTHRVPIPSTSGHFLHVETHITDPAAPWIVLSNSLLTNTSLWSWVLPHILSPQPDGPAFNGIPKFLGKYNTFNVLLHDQRGHGKSSYPSSQSVDAPLPCTIPLLASDIALILSHLSIPSVHAVIGVSQGGATALAFGAMFPHLLRGKEGGGGIGGVVSCDTGPKTPAGNKEAWEERMTLAKSVQDEKQGMGKLAKVTSPRWFGKGSRCSLETETETELGLRRTRTEVIDEMIVNTPREGFCVGAKALSDYDLISGQDMSDLDSGKGLLDSDVPVLLVAGELDGAGKVAQGMMGLKKNWDERRKERGVKEVEMRVVERAGHLPMVDETEEWWKVVGSWLVGLGR